MTVEWAVEVKQWRCAENGTWRWVAARCWEEFGVYAPRGGEEWDGRRDNQYVGKLLCEAAATRLGDDPDVEPWN
jgi:hypothetical protein